MAVRRNTMVFYVFAVTLAVVGLCSGQDGISDLPRRGRFQEPLSAYRTANRMLLRKLLYHDQESEIDNDSLNAPQFGFFDFPVPYLAQPLDSVDSISDAFGIPKQVLVELNWNVNRNDSSAFIPEGTALNIPGHAAVPPLSTTITTSNPEELRQLCTAYQVQDSALRNANPFIDVEGFSKMTTVRIPRPENYPVHECSKNAICIDDAQTLASVAARHDVDFELLLSLNPQILQQGGKIFHNQVLIKPGSNDKQMQQTKLDVPAASMLYDAILSTPGIPVSVSHLKNVVQLNEDIVESFEDLVKIVDHARSISLMETESDTEGLEDTTEAPEDPHFKMETQDEMQGDEQPQEGSNDDDQPQGEKPDDEQPQEETPGDEQPQDEAPGDEQPQDEAPGDEQPQDEAPGDEQPQDEAPGDEQPQDEAPGDEQPQDEGPGDEQPLEGPGDEEPQEEMQDDEQSQEEAQGGEQSQGETQGDSSAQEDADVAQLELASVDASADEDQQPEIGQVSDENDGALRQLLEGLSSELSGAAGLVPEDLQETQPEMDSEGLHASSETEAQERGGPAADQELSSGDAEDGHADEKNSIAAKLQQYLAGSASGHAGKQEQGREVATDQSDAPSPVSPLEWDVSDEQGAISNVLKGLKQVGSLDTMASKLLVLPTPKNIPIGDRRALLDQTPIGYRRRSLAENHDGPSLLQRLHINLGKQLLVNDKVSSDSKVSSDAPEGTDAHARRLLKLMKGAAAETFGDEDLHDKADRLFKLIHHDP